MTMDLHLAGKTAVVTGASKGIGFAITQALAAEGVNVVAGARAATTELSDLAARTTVTPVAVDLTSPDGPARLIEAAIAAINMTVLADASLPISHRMKSGRPPKRNATTKTGRRPIRSTRKAAHRPEIRTVTLLSEL